MKLIFASETGKRVNLLNNLLSLAGFKTVKELQVACQLNPDSIFGLDSWNALYKKLLKFVVVPFTGYNNQQFDKKQIVWHHSAGNDNAKGMFTDWQNDKRWHVATCIGIDDNGTIVKGYDEGAWAVHVGAWDVKDSQNFKHLTAQQLYNIEQKSVGVEICNWGFVRKQNNKFYNYVGLEVPISKVTALNYKGEQYYEAYTDAEIQSLKLWTLLVALRFDIPLTYSEADMWQVSKKAINGEAGLFTHNSFIDWKSDVSPQKKLIEMAKSLESFTK